VLPAIGDRAFTPDVELVLSAVPAEVPILSGQPTRVWQYQGEVLVGNADALLTIPNSHLGPIVQVQRGQKLRIHFSNQLPEPSKIHWHGLHVPEAADGHPRLAIDPGESYTYEFTVADRAGTYWFPTTPTGAPARRCITGWQGCSSSAMRKNRPWDYPPASTASRW